MATTMKKTNTKPITSNTSEVKEANKVETKPIKKERKFEATDGIKCKSITVGGLYMEGIKSHILYEWSDIGDETDVEYADLLAAVRSNSNAYITQPLFVVEDEDFIAQNPQLNKIYETMYSFDELRDVILTLSPDDMKATILTLPEGAKNSIKATASQLVSSGMLDSVNKIKYLDEIFGTELKLMAVL